MSRVIIGIDPDIEKSGVAVLDPETRGLTLSSLSFPEVVDLFFAYRARQVQGGLSVTVVVEAGWLNKGNWHIGKRGGKAYAATLGVSVGRNQETGRKLIEMAEHCGLKVSSIRPLLKVWSGPDRKITREELEQFTGPVGRCSQDARDAALIAWTYANLPIRVKVGGKKTGKESSTI